MKILSTPPRIPAASLDRNGFYRVHLSDRKKIRLDERFIAYPNSVLDFGSWRAVVVLANVFYCNSLLAIHRLAWCEVGGREKIFFSTSCDENTFMAVGFLVKSAVVRELQSHDGGSYNHNFLPTLCAAWAASTTSAAASSASSWSTTSSWGTSTTSYDSVSFAPSREASNLDCTRAVWGR
jgi:hypothetical protein